MNILELAGFHSNYGSNFIPSLMNLEGHLRSRGHKTYFIFSNQNLSKKFLEWEIPFSEKYDTTLMNFKSISFVKNVVKFIKEKNIDIVHVHFTSSIFVSAIKRMCPKNVLFLEMIHSCPYNNKKTFKAFLKRVRNFFVLDKRILKICISKSMMEMVQYTFPGQKLVYVTNAIELSRFKKSARNENENFNLLLFGYNYFVKGVDLAIKAVLKVKDKIKGIHLNIIMGDNFQKNKEIITREFGEIPSCVSILEPTHDIDAFYKTNAVFLNASRSEGLSYAILEAYYAGALCIISDIPTNKEIQLPNIISFESESVDSLSKAIIDAYLEWGTYKNDTDYILEKFSVDSWSKQIIELMKL